MFSFRRVAAFLVLINGVAGCQHSCYRRATPVPPPLPPGALVDPRAPVVGQPFLGAPTAPQLGQPIQPIQPIQPSGAELLLPEPLPGASEPAIIGSGLSQRRDFSPSPINVRLGRPEQPRQRTPVVVRLHGPSDTPTPAEVTAPRPEPSSPPPPPVFGRQESADEFGPEPPNDMALDMALFPVGIPNFCPVYDSVANGLRADLGGLDWLKANQYRTLLHLHEPGLETAADRRLIERLGFDYRELAVDVTRFDAETIDRFNAVVNDPTERPLFVYDRPGSLAGAMWYAHFRTIARCDHETAKAKAIPLGYTELTEAERAELTRTVEAMTRE